MVCIYCGHDTKVNNSRLQKRSNSVWRRRKCLNCQNVFSTIEAPDLAQGLRIEPSDGNLTPFVRAILLTSIYEVCKHRNNPADAADALTATVISNLLRKKEAVIDRTTLVTEVMSVSKRFDKAAAVQYSAYHPL